MPSLWNQHKSGRVNLFLSFDAIKSYFAQKNNNSEHYELLEARSEIILKNFINEIEAIKDAC
ncbi:MAG: hypothetical protein QM571_02850 [Micrococcaceae bacterium]